MAAIKFSKQNIQPNPLEVDYWVDITSNPYGGNIKYHNGYDWVDLLNSKGTPINLDAYYNKVLMNQMLAGKASVESVDSKVDDTEVADVIKNIEFKDRGDDGVEMVVLKYNDMTVGVTLPVASNTTSGIITNKSFKDLVKQNQLQGVYSEMYDKLSEIRQQYQRKLKAGKNIQIDSDNTIHAVGEISLDWDDVYNKPDFDKLFATVALAIQSESTRAKNAEQQLSARITDHVDVVEGKLDLKADANSVYTKDQIDEKISGIYKIKGSRTFQDLPTSGNLIGDVYNITNNFSLDGVEYPLGTNVVYTATGWDALAGIFDSTEIENKVDEIDTKVDEEVIRAKLKELELDKKFDGYLRLTGGTLTHSYDGDSFIIQNTAVSPYFSFRFGNKTIGSLQSYAPTGQLRYAPNGIGWKVVLHEDNYSNYALPLTGGTINGNLYIDGNSPKLLSINRQNDVPLIEFNVDQSTQGYIGVVNNNPIFKDRFLINTYKIYHEGNFNPSDYLPLTGGTVNGNVIINSSTYANQLTINRNQAAADAMIKFSNSSDGVLGYIGIGGSGSTACKLNPYFSTGINEYKIWHEGNDGEGSGLGADKLDGKHASDFYDLIGGKLIPDNSDLNEYKTAGTYCVGTIASAKTILNLPSQTAGTLHVMYPTGVKRYVIQTYTAYSTAHIYSRCINTEEGIWSDWKTIAFTDSDITGNAATATKATQDSEGNVITDTYALKSDLIIGLNVTDGVYAVKADGSLCTIDEADTSCTGVALVAGEHKFMIAKSNATDGRNSTLYWGKNLYKKDVAGITNISLGADYIGEGKKYGTDFTTWSTGPVVDFNGAANTAAIIEGYTEHGVSMDARDMCTVLNTFNASDSYNDWYVPACGQLALMYLAKTDINAALAKIGGTAFESANYWSSSEYDADSAWRVNFGRGYVGNGNKDVDYRVRFIRDIKIESPKSVKESITEIKNQLKQPASSALKLATPVKLWGNTFDGSNSVNGSMFFENNSHLHIADNQNNPTSVLVYNDSNLLALGYSSSGKGHKTSVYGSPIDFCTGTNRVDRMIIDNNGNVGIGTTNPQFKLDVNGNMSLKDQMYLGGKRVITDDYGKNYLLFGTNVCDTYVRGSSLHLQLGKNYDKLITFDSEGNLGLGTVTPQYKLDVNGGISIKDRSKFYGRNDFSGKNGLFIYRSLEDYSVDKGHCTLSFKDSGFTMKVDHFDSSLPENRTPIDFLINNMTTGDVNIRGTYSTSSPIEKRYGGNMLFATFDDRIEDHRRAAGMYIINSSNELVACEYKNLTLGVFGGSKLRSLFGGATADRDCVEIHGGNLALLNLSSSNSQTNGVMFSWNDTTKTLNINEAYFDYSINDGNTRDTLTLTVNGKAIVEDDWYGVSWSENSSDPTCTRIGNMALHRSLPILSAMKGYIIVNKENPVSEGLIIPLNDDWNNKKYTWATNNIEENFGHITFNTMVKIPEFWYIDDYEPSTKTHNLKISQTAKAGWIHHKEAYVGAYEGSYVSLGYRSKKGEIPLVSWSRTDLRNAARKNGLEDEYKWNIYTYEEYRAICHLFLVEYATRNSQLAVNTALTTDGFKQGGLGSGCTTGTATINGQTVYSFIPTGTTDSLGNGSGQVAYTVTQTDADGNEIGTVTRYANRYRGIENPFGHIWKHVDDIVNVYNAEITYKTVYKCNKPEHFATNKNAKYKPLCSFPGGSKMQGWSKEIKATINCDFFKYSVGGSESTYWCDYNYDNDDTSEHCLLIGGDSGSGGSAGLFNFNLHYSVSSSSVYIGSRLTYLPWAE